MYPHSLTASRRIAFSVGAKSPGMVGGFQPAVLIRTFQKFGITPSINTIKLREFLEG